VEQLYRGGANTVGKQHFTLLYSRAREAAFTYRNIKSGWSKTGLYPFNADVVLRDIQKPPIELNTNPTVDPQLLQCPCDQLTTPVTGESLGLLRRTIEQLTTVADFCSTITPHTARQDPFSTQILPESGQSSAGASTSHKAGLVGFNRTRRTRTSSCTLDSPPRVRQPAHPYPDHYLALDEAQQLIEASPVVTSIGRYLAA
jgi:hypothetical protein